MAEIYVPGGFDFMAAGNALSQMQTAQQARQANALQMQYAAEDRARADQARKAAAGNALAERAALSKALENSVVGMAGPEQPNLGNAQKDLAMQGRFGAASAISNVQEQFAKQKEQEAKAAGQSLTNTGLDIKNADARLTQLQRFAPMVTDVQSAANYGRMSAEQFPELKNLFGSPEDAAKRSAELFAKDPAGWLRHSLNLTGEQLVQANAADAKAKSEAGASKAGVFGDTNEGRQLQIVNEVLKGTRLPSDPEYALAHDALYAGKSMPAYNPDTKQMELVKAPATAPANLPPPTFGKASAATPPLTMASVASNLRPPVQTNALSTMNGALRPPVQANALAAPPDAPIITKAPTGGLTEAQKFKLKGDTSKDYAIATETLRSIQDVTRVVDKLEKADISGVTGYMSLAPSLTEESTIAESNIEALKAKMTALAKVMSAATGKLGNLAIQEYQLLQNQIDTFDPYKGEVATRDQLSNIKNTMKRIEFVVRDVYSKEYGGEDNPFAQFRELPTNVGGEANAAPATLMPDNVKSLVDKYNK